MDIESRATKKLKQEQMALRKTALLSTCYQPMEPSPPTGALHQEPPSNECLEVFLGFYHINIMHVRQEENRVTAWFDD